MKKATKDTRPQNSRDTKAGRKASAARRNAAAIARADVRWNGALAVLNLVKRSGAIIGGKAALQVITSKYAL